MCGLVGLLLLPGKNGERRSPGCPSISAWASGAVLPWSMPLWLDQGESASERTASATRLEYADIYQILKGTASKVYAPRENKIQDCRRGRLTADDSFRGTKGALRC